MLERLYPFIISTSGVWEYLLFHTLANNEFYNIFFKPFKVWQMKSNTSVLFYLAYLFFVRLNIFWYAYFTFYNLFCALFLYVFCESINLCVQLSYTDVFSGFTLPFNFMSVVRKMHCYTSEKWVSLLSLQTFFKPKFF